MGLLDGTDEEKSVNSLMTELGFEEEPQAPNTIRLFEPDNSIPQAFIEEVAEEEPPQPTEEETEIDAELTEAEERLAKAQLYKQFITGVIFDGNGPGVKEVSGEFRSFARKQLQILLGVIPKVDES